MAQPRAYTRQANFTDHTTESPSDPQVGSKLDSEFDALNLTPVPRHPNPPPEGESKNVSPLTEKTVGDQTLEPQALLRPCLQMKRDSPPLECWCLSSARFALSRVGILQRDGVSRCVSPGLQSRSPVALATPAANSCGPCLHVGEWRTDGEPASATAVARWRTTAAVLHLKRKPYEE